MPETCRWGDEGVLASTAALTARAPLVHCLTNIVVANLTANVLLAIGASPAMVENAQESGPFAAIAEGVLINLGTLSAEREVAMRAAAAGAAAAGRPWVLDPVAAGALEHRTNFAAELLELGPAIIRGNASEILSLAGVRGAAGKGVDSSAGSEDAIEAARELALRAGCVIAVSGETDFLTDGGRLITVQGGHPLLTRVTGVGCALGSLMAAYCAVTDGPLRAAATASAVVAAAGERAAACEPEPGPGTFAVRLVDAVAALAAESAGTSDAAGGRAAR